MGIQILLKLYYVIIISSTVIKHHFIKEKFNIFKNILNIWTLYNICTRLKKFFVQFAFDFSYFFKQKLQLFNA